MKVAHVSDTHLGYLQYRLTERKKDFLRAFEQVVDKCIEKRIDILIHTGDLFESYHPDMSTFSAVISLLQKLKSARIEVIAITGNHDRALRRGVIPPHRVLEELGFIKFLNFKGDLEADSFTFKIDGLFIAGFQYLPRRMLLSLKEKLFPILSELAAGSKTSILLFHQGIKQYLPFEESYEMDFADLPEGFDYYAGGHVHAFILEKFRKGILSYAGSTEFRNRKEAERGKRGFNIFDTELKKVERVELEGLRPFGIFSATEDTIEKTIEKIEEFLSGCKEPPVILLDYFYQSRDVSDWAKKLNELKSRTLLTRVFPKRVINGKEEIETKGKNFAEFLIDFLNGKGRKTTELAVELLNASGKEEMEEILRSFTQKELGESWKEIERFFEDEIC